MLSVKFIIIFASFFGQFVLWAFLMRNAIGGRANKKLWKLLSSAKSNNNDEGNKKGKRKRHMVEEIVGCAKKYATLFVCAEWPSECSNSGLPLSARCHSVLPTFCLMVSPSLGLPISLFLPLSVSLFHFACPAGCEAVHTVAQFQHSN